MALIVSDCPHCKTAQSGMPLFGVRAYPVEKSQYQNKDGYGNSLYLWNLSVGAICQKCNKPVSAILGGGKPKKLSEYADFKNTEYKRLLGEGEVNSLGYNLIELWPRPIGPNIPSHLPFSIEKALLQAESNYPLEGNEEASAMMYRRALELALSDLFPERKGNLSKRIKSIISEKILPAPIGEWADEIRLLGNEAAHDPEEVDREELKTIRGFCDALLKYLYSLPAEVAARKKSSL